MALFKRQQSAPRQVSLEKAAAAVHADLRGTAVLVEGPVRDLSLNGAPAYLAVTASCVAWAPGARPDVVLHVEFDKVHELGEQDGAIKLTTRDAAYAAMLRDPSNPNGETDAMFFYGERDDLREAMLEGTKNLSPAWADWRAGHVRYRALATTPLQQWRGCPLCESDFVERVENAAKCSDCGRVFCDAGFEPVVSEERADYGRLRRAKPHQVAMLSELESVKRPLPFIIRPAEWTMGPLVMQDLETECRAFS